MLPSSSTTRQWVMLRASDEMLTPQYHAGLVNINFPVLANTLKLVSIYRIYKSTHILVIIRSKLFSFAKIGCTRKCKEK